MKSGVPALSLSLVRLTWAPLVLFTDLVAQRGEKLELLIDKTENLVDAVSLVCSFVLTLNLLICVMDVVSLCSPVGDV